MKEYTTFVLLIAAAFLTGCATPKVWYQEGRSFDETRRDLAACRVEALRSYNPLAAANIGFFIAAESVKNDLINNCMTAKGYSLITKDKLPDGAIGLPEGADVDSPSRDDTPDAQYAMAVRYADGDGVPRDPQRAFNLYKRAAESGHLDAQVELGAAYLAGFGVTPNPTEGVKCIRRAADRGNPAGQALLGFCYAEGRGVPQDESEGVQWYVLAASQGEPRAAENLGHHYRFGLGVSTNYVEAARWYRVAAEQGVPVAQESLAMMYRLGQGVTQDDSEAVKWDKRAASQGSPGGQLGLALCYQSGYGVPKDVVEAYKWLCLASAGGLEQAVRVRDGLRKEMTVEQIAEAQQRARQFTAKPER